jgi:hypothetical protein
MSECASIGVIPAKAGTQWRNRPPIARRYWVPAFAAMTPEGGCE